MRRAIAFPVMLLAGAGVLLCLISYFGWLTGRYHPLQSGPPIIVCRDFRGLGAHSLTNEHPHPRFQAEGSVEGCLTWMSLLDENVPVGWQWDRDGDNVS